MKIVIIGSKGFIGSTCVQYFSQLGHQVFEVDIVPFININYTKVDTQNADYNSIFEAQQLDVCINASGSAHVGFSFEQPNIDFELNVINVQKLLVAIRNFNPKCKLINFSSAAVYGNPINLPIKETDTCKPLSPYGFHKWQSELLLSEYHKFFGLKTCSLRVFSAFGPGLKKQLFWDLYQKCLQSQTITLFGTGKESRDFIYIDDLIQMVQLIIDNASFEGNIFNAANGIETNIDEATQTFVKHFDASKQIVFTGEIKIGDPINWQADITEMQHLGYKQNISFESGIINFTKWLKEKK